jgi:orotidine-5'-phosphate decarboxylase
MQQIGGGKKLLFEQVLETSSKWGTIDNMMFVVGATKAEWFKKIRKIVPGHFLLVPGIGAQGGNLEEVSMNGMNDQCGLLVNSSREIIYADGTANFDEVARIKAREVREEMETYLKRKKII